MSELPRLCIVTNRLEVRDCQLPRVIAQALSGVPRGGALVQLREKDLDGRDLLNLARQLHAITSERACPLLVNDRVDIAMVVSCGAHLPADGLPIATARSLLGDTAIIGRSTHGSDEVATAHTAGAQFAMFGPVWSTPSKVRYGAPQGLAALRNAASQGTVYAIGGIDSTDKAQQARQAGAYGVAVMRAIMASANPAETCENLYRSLHDTAYSTR